MTKKFKHYFLTHTVRIVFNLSLTCHLQIKEATRHITHWTVRYVEFVNTNPLKTSVWELGVSDIGLEPEPP
jgi:hypothetical protein